MKGTSVSSGLYSSSCSSSSELTGTALGLESELELDSVREDSEELSDALVSLRNAARAAASRAVS